MRCFYNPLSRDGLSVLDGTDTPSGQGGLSEPSKSDNPLLLKFGEILQPQ